MINFCPECIGQEVEKLYTFMETIKNSPYYRDDYKFIVDTDFKDLGWTSQPKNDIWNCGPISSHYVTQIDKLWKSNNKFKYLTVKTIPAVFKVNHSLFDAKNYRVDMLQTILKKNLSWV